MINPPQAVRFKEFQNFHSLRNLFLFSCILDEFNRPISRLQTVPTRFLIFSSCCKMLWMSFLLANPYRLKLSYSHTSESISSSISKYIDIKLFLFDSFRNQVCRSNTSCASRFRDCTSIRFLFFLKKLECPGVYIHGFFCCLLIFARVSTNDCADIF